jgi:hypothetical protein
VLLLLLLQKPSLQSSPSGRCNQEISLQSSPNHRCNHHQFIAAITRDLAATITNSSLKSSLQSRDLAAIITKPSLQSRDLAAIKRSRCNHHPLIAAITMDLAAIITQSSLQSRDLDRQSLLQNCLLLKLRSTEKGRLIKANLANEHNTAKAQYER